MVTKAGVELVPLLKEKHAEHSCYELHLAADTRIIQRVHIGWPLNTHIAPDLLFFFDRNITRRVLVIIRKGREEQKGTTVLNTY